MLNQIFIAVPAFLIAITLLVAVHEFGHFWVARKLGVKVLRFSIGFGKPLWKKTPKNGETEYVISALPLGGYVKMLDERFEENVAAVDLPRAYNRQPVWKRILILLAGPFANFLFAISVFYALFLYGVQDFKPFVTPVNVDSPAAIAGLVPGDEVVAVNNQPVRSFEDLILRLVDGVISDEIVTFKVKRKTELLALNLRVPKEVAKLQDPSKLLQGLGLSPWQPAYYPELVAISEGSAAKESSLRAGDQVKNLGALEILNVQHFVTEIQKRPGQTVELLIIRDGREARQTITIAEKRINGQNVGIIGASLRVPESVINSMRTRSRFGPLESLQKACKSTYDMSALSLKMFREMLKGKVSVKNLSGPISIAQQASYSAQSGLDQFVKFLALISIALGIVNLLPIPMLDGGQIMFSLMELVKGSPVSERTELIFQQLGIMCIVFIMGLAIYNDIERLIL